MKFSYFINTLFHSHSHSYSHLNNLQSPNMLTVYGVKCPNCLKEGKNVWVAPGNNCGHCGTKCEKTISRVALKLPLLSVACTLSILSVIAILGSDLNIGHSFTTLNDINIFVNDAPRPWGLYFQDTASPQMEALVELHNNIMFYLIIILFTVGWILAAIVVKYVGPVISNKYVNHGTLVELVWTITPGLILILIAFTSFRLLYLNDEVSDINVTIYAEGHQWYWSYLLPDFLGENGDNIEFDSYLTPESDLTKGQLRMLDVDEGILLPEVTHTKLIISSGDVIHSFACPSLGLKTDAYPGRLNQASTLLNRLSTYFGQCSEICGILHSSMPIKISSVPLEKFLIYLSDK